MITVAIRLRYDYDPTTTYRALLLPIRRKQKTNSQLFVVVVSQSNHSCDIGLRSDDDDVLVGPGADESAALNLPDVVRTQW